jgi:hypothetical protein
MMNFRTSRVRWFLQEGGNSGDDEVGGPSIPNGMWTMNGKVHGKISLY